MNLTFMLDGSRPLRSASISDVAAGGTVGSAATTVDVADALLVNQTTADKALTLPTPTVNALRRCVVCNVGSAAFFVYGRMIRTGASHEFLYVPSVGWRRTSSGPQVIAQSAVAITAPANDTSENTLVTLNIPGGVIGANGRVLIYTEWSHTASTNSKIARARLNAGSTSMTLTVTSGTAVACATLWGLANRNSESSQVHTANVGFPVSSTTVVPVTQSVDTSAATTLTITAQKATGSETMTLEQYSIVLERFD